MNELGREEMAHSVIQLWMCVVWYEPLCLLCIAAIYIHTSIPSQPIKQKFMFFYLCALYYIPILFSERKKTIKQS